VGTTGRARSLARAAARDLRRAGVNVNLAPVADLSRPGSVMRGRAFPGGPAAVARLTAASVRGYRGSLVAPTVKHFPGLGAANTNTDDAPAAIRRDARVLGANDLPPFRAAIAAGVPLVMLSHARYPALDPDAIASQSREIVHRLLKQRLGFRGVAVTDSLEAEAVRAAMGPEQAAVRSIRAGVDLILTTGPGSHLRVWRALMDEARRDPRFRARMVDAASRVRALQRSLASPSG
jgi:beta-N-acetylhexosaminidase